MGDPFFFCIITGFFCFIQIEFFLMLPEKLRHILTSNPVLAFLLSFASSLAISYFTGIGSFVGLCNVCADIPFTIYVLWYKRKSCIAGLGVASYRIFRVPVFPKIVVRYEKDGKLWVK